MLAARQSSGKPVSFHLEEIFYYLFFALLLFAKGIGLYDGQWQFTLFLVAACLCWGVKVLLTEHTVGELLEMAVLLFMGLLIYYNSGEKAAFVSLLVILGLKNVPVKRVFKLGAVVWTFCFICTTTLAHAGLIADTIKLHDKVGGVYILRYSLGYTHPNVLHDSYFILLAFLFYFIKLDKKRLLLASAAAWLGSLYIFLYSYSYTGMIVTTLYLAANLYFQLRGRNAVRQPRLFKVQTGKADAGSCPDGGVPTAFTLAEKLLICLVFPLCAAFAILGPLLTKDEVFTFFDELLNSRWRLSYYFLTEQPLTLFGTRFTDLPGASTVMDSAYVYALMTYGVVYFALACVSLFRTVRYELKREGRAELAILLSFFVLSITSQTMANFSFKSLPLLFMGECYYLNPLLRVGGAAGRLWNRPLRLTPWAGRQVTVKLGIPRGLRRFCGLFVKCLPLLLAVGALCGILAGGIYYNVMPGPSALYVDKRAKSLFDRETVVLDVSALPEDFDGIFFGDIEGETELEFYVLTGTTVWVERVRDAVTAGVYTGALAGLLLGVACAACGMCRGKGQEAERKPPA